jgi:threonine/homoserine/homoserine lactone efflux protein
MPTALIPAFLLASLLIELTPGPNMAYLALVSATKGRRLGLAATAGVALGLLVIGAAAALGLAALVAASPVAFQAMRWAGVLYLLWLAWEAWTGGGEVSPGRVDPAQGPARYFRRGFITNLLNPKAGLFFLAVLPGFVDSASAVLPQTAVLTLLYVAVATAIHLAIVGLAGTARRWFDDPASPRRGRRIFAVLLTGVAIWFVLRTA